MGFMRLGLALVVLIFHAGYGGAGGPIAVYGFYVLSGYLISRVYIERYDSADYGLAIFYWNRFLRIVPLFIAASLMAYLSLLVVQQTITPTLKDLPVNGGQYLTAEHFLWRDYWAGLRPAPVIKGGTAPQFVLYFGWLAQFWTVSIELAFYAAAPLFCVLRRRWGPLATYLLLAATFALYLLYSVIPGKADIGLYSDIVYRNAIPTMFFFMIGMTLYEMHLAVKKRISFGYAALSTRAILTLILVGTKHIKTGLPAVYDFVLWQFVAVAGIAPVIFSRECANAAVRKVDSLFANIGYGGYLNQSVVLIFYFAYRVVWLKDTDYPNTSFLHYFALVAATAALSCVTFFGIEEPFNRLRATYRRQPQAA
jgi:peptidoglycan/LPS O-acetylase OafA/YrhL